MDLVVWREPHRLALDHMEAEELRGLGRDGVLRLARSGELRFDPMRRTGTVFHMLSSVNDGRTGFTAIADSADEADALYARVQQTLIAEGEIERRPSRSRRALGGQPEASSAA